MGDKYELFEKIPIEYLERMALVAIALYEANVITVKEARSYLGLPTSLEDGLEEKDAVQ